MPKSGGQDYFVRYYNNEGEPNEKRKKGQLPKPTSAEILKFLKRTIIEFEKKYGKRVKLIRMSQEMKDIIDNRVQGKEFLKGINLVVVNFNYGLRTIDISELKEDFTL
ncbi:MAG TPA: hypothetical protein ENG48_00230 [Candidatus Atribacteria bacterium]|nr:hypothetical protein [Candidatus Atribacteria bacterium]